MQTTALLVITIINICLHILGFLLFQYDHHKNKSKTSLSEFMRYICFCQSVLCARTRNPEHPGGWWTECCRHEIRCSPRRTAGISKSRAPYKWTFCPPDFSTNQNHFPMGKMPILSWNSASQQVLFLFNPLKKRDNIQISQKETRQTQYAIFFPPRCQFSGPTFLQTALKRSYFR